MPRRARAAIRPVEPDAQHRSRLVQQVINKVMVDGKKSLAENIVYHALAIVGERTGRPPVDVLDEAIRELTPVLEVRSRRVGGATYQVPVEVLDEAIKELTPVLEVRSRRVGGATYQVPVEVPARRARTLAVRWLVQFAQGRREKSMAERLANEMLDATNQQGGAWKRKDDIYRMAQANKAFAHYRW
jgi:small subunit ribosomal protein S7